MTTVLIADADAAIRETIRMVLEDEGYRFVESTSATTTMQMLLYSSTPLLVLLDLSLSSSTVTLAYQIAAAPELSQRHRFLLFTARILREAVPAEAALLTTLHTFIYNTIRKPFDIDTLLTCLHNAEASLSAADALAPTQQRLAPPDGSLWAGEESLWKAPHL